MSLEYSGRVNDSRSLRARQRAIVRFCSKLTEHTDCCLRLVQCSSCYRSFLKILIKHENNQALIVRVCFILGNMMAKSEEARLTFMSDHRALQTLTKLLQGYIQLDSLVRFFVSLEAVVSILSAKSHLGFETR